ncbi:MAG: ImmA/IrrE family metallo-endopeptidase [Ruminococcaceae bacterium]|nr:ImmA/IrrE family metallo-endopeptidase [Oscillospiraceae bacterium]
MKYIEGVDYWVRYVQFPNMASESVAASHGDGTFTIYINTLFPPEKQAERLRHELAHLEQEHFYRDELTIRQLEHAADGLAAENVPTLPVTDYRVLPGPPPPFVAIRWDGQSENVSFGFRVPDDSLLPHFRQGELLLCDDCALTPGDVGLFQYRGVTLCRQYHRDVFGITYLFAVDRRRPQEDILIPAGETRSLLCLGRVQTERRLPLP